MMFFERQLRFSTPVLSAGCGSVYFASGLAIKGNGEAGLVRVRATDAGGNALPFSALVDLRQLATLRRAAAARHGHVRLPVTGGNSATGYDSAGRLVLHVQTTLEIEHDSLGVLVLAPGPDISWTIGVPGDQVNEFLVALEECAAGAPCLAVA